MKPTRTPRCLIFLIVIVFQVVGIGSSYAQIGNCTEPEASAILDVGNVRARIYNNGALYWKGGQNLYESPKGSGVNAHFASYFMIGGFIDEELRMAASSYGPYEFWTGPIDAEGNPPADCSVYDHIWEIHSDDFQQFDSEGIFSENMLNWPWELGAPVVDGDGIPNNYNLEDGDRPELLGNQTLWWVMNDRGNEHLWSETHPIGVEVHASAFAFEHFLAGDITFYRYRIYNKNAKQLTNAFLGIFADTDLGNASDDYFGSDSLLHLGYSYNAIPVDKHGYEEFPPAIGYTFLITPEAPMDAYDNDRDGEVDEPGEQTGMYSAGNLDGGAGFWGEPSNGTDMYNILRGIWKDGQTFVEGGTGYFYAQNWPADLSVRPTRFIYSGDPGTQSYWTEFQRYPNSTTPNPPSDLRLAVSAGPFNLHSGESTEFLVALVLAHGSDYLDSVRKLKTITRNLHTSPQSYLASGYQPEFADPTFSNQQFVLAFGQNFPNPFTGRTTIRYSIPKSMQVRLSIFDILGREIDVLIETTQEAGVYTTWFDGSHLPAGIYYARLEVDHLTFTKKMVRIP